MSDVTISQIVARLEQLPPEKLAEVYRFITALAGQSPGGDLYGDSAWLTMLASEAALRRDWDTPAEDEAWANL